MTGLRGDALKIRLQAPPVEGKANATLLAFIADKLDVPRNAVELVHGHTGRDKIVRVRLDRAMEKIGRLAPSD